MPRVSISLLAQVFVALLQVEPVILVEQLIEKHYPSRNQEIIAPLNWLLKVQVTLCFRYGKFEETYPPVDFSLLYNPVLSICRHPWPVSADHRKHRGF